MYFTLIPEKSVSFLQSGRKYRQKPLKKKGTEHEKGS